LTRENWRFAYASVAGSGHLRQGRPGQDAATCRLLDSAEGSELLVAAAADGAGSARRGEDGAQAACATFAEAIERHLLREDACPVETSESWSRFVDVWLAGFQSEIAARSEQAGGNPRDYACTFLGAVVAADRAGLLQIGDGAIVLDDGDCSADFRVFAWPQRGEYANETYFATDPSAGQLVTRGVVPGRVEEIALFTDGLQALVLDNAARAPHAPFFAGMFPVVRASPPGHAPALSDALAGFLASPRVRSRTDDDITLILATRREA
jgi:hypothetical protein